MHNLLLRILTALVLLPIVLWIFYQGGILLAFLHILIAIVCLIEYKNMASLKPSQPFYIHLLITSYILMGITSLFFLREKGGFAAILLVFIITWSNDTLAYFIGKSFGKHKLCPQISPKKTWEGFIAGALGSVVIALFCSSLLSTLSVSDILYISIPAMFLGPAGDLLESRIKRFYGVKDSGKLLPGHGGMLDRIDALLLTSPWALLYLMLS